MPLSGFVYDKIRLTVINPRVLKIVSLSSDVFERRARTGSGVLTLLGRDFEQILEQFVCLRVKTLYTHRQLMSLGTGALKVSGEGPEVIQAPQGGLHGNPASGNHPSSSR